MVVKGEYEGGRITRVWAWVCRVTVAAWRWTRQQWERITAPQPLTGEVSPRQARRLEKQRRKEIRRQLKEKAVRQAA